MFRNRLWNELTQAKHNEEFSTIFSDYQRKWLKVFNVIVLTFSTAGVMGWKIWESTPLVACIIIAVISLFRLLQPQILFDEKKLTQLESIHDFYFNYYNKLENLWFDYENEKYNENEAQEIFFQLKQSEEKVNKSVNELIVWKPKKLVLLAKANSNTYFKQIFN